MEINSSTRKFFINTLFDSTFTLLGVVSGSAFTIHPDVRVILMTLITSSIALGISSGVSVYEAEKLEGEKTVDAIEEAMIHSLENTVHTETLHRDAWLSSIIVFFTPLFSCLISAIPFVLSRFGFLSIENAAWLSIGFSLSTLLVVGTVMANNSSMNPLYRGFRMAFFGLIAFLIGFFLDSFI